MRLPIQDHYTNYPTALHECRPLDLDFDTPLHHQLLPPVKLNLHGGLFIQTNFLNFISGCGGNKRNMDNRLRREQ